VTTRHSPRHSSSSRNTLSQDTQRAATYRSDGGSSCWDGAGRQAGVSNAWRHLGRRSSGLGRLRLLAVLPATMKELGLVGLLVVDARGEAVVLLLAAGVQLTVALEATLQSQSLVLGGAGVSRRRRRLLRQEVAHLILSYYRQTPPAAHQITHRVAARPPPFSHLTRPLCCKTQPV